MSAWQDVRVMREGISETGSWCFDLRNGPGHGLMEVGNADREARVGRVEQVSCICRIFRHNG